MALPWISAMADSEIPKTMGDAVLKFLWNSLPFIFFLVGIERVIAGEPLQAGALFFALLVNLVVVVRWHQIATFLARRRGTMVYVLILIGLAGALALGFAIGGLSSRIGQLWSSSQPSGRIVWNFDQPADYYFLGMGRLNDQEIRVVGFQAHGKNTSTDPVSEFSGFIRSDLTNAQRAIYLLAQDPSSSNPPIGPQMMLPTPPDQTYGIPGLADFDITTSDKAFMDLGKDGEPISDFLRHFGAFTLVLKYDGTTIERHFTLEQIKEQVGRLDKQARPLDTSAPRVTRKLTATPVPGFPFAVPAPAPALPPPNAQAPPKG
jgi:hypothetical protein